MRFELLLKTHPTRVTLQAVWPRHCPQSKRRRGEAQVRRGCELQEVSQRRGRTGADETGNAQEVEEKGYLGYHLRCSEESAEMSSSHERESWLSNWWPFLVIAFGVTFISILALWKPSY